MNHQQSELQNFDQAVQFLQNNGVQGVKAGIILGSGLGDIVSNMRPVFREIPYSDIPNFPSSSVVGHSGKLIFGELEGIPLLVMSGRVHFYEGYGMRQVVFPVRVLLRLGIRSLIITNAAGGINRSYHAGDLMLITDHINLLGGNPLTGPNLEEFGPRFPDMSEIYDNKLRKLALAKASQLELILRQGVYVATAGPSYETPAEIEMFRRLGADAVGMSTVPEAIAANHAGAKILGISCITNMAAGVLAQKLDHQEVLTTAARTREVLTRLLSEIIQQMHQEGYC